MEENRKICTKCNKELPETEEYFYRKKTGKNGLMAECKSCNNLRKHGLLKLNPIPKNGYKICNLCNRELPSTTYYFYKREKSYDGLRSNCIDCEKRNAINYFKTDNGKESHQKSNMNWYLNHKEEILDKSRKYYERNKDKILMCMKEYRNTENWRKSKRREYARRKDMDSIELFPNPFSDGVEIDWHHIDDNNIVAIPRDLHRLYTGFSINKHRSLCKVIVKQIYGGIIE